MTDTPTALSKAWTWLTKDRSSKSAHHTASVLENGILEVGTPEFRACCAYHTDGYALVSVPQFYDEDVQIEIENLIKRGVLPPDIQMRRASLKEIEDAYNARPMEMTKDIAQVTQNKIYAILEEAVALRASDVKLIIRGHSTELRIHAAGEEHSFECPLASVNEGNGAINFLFEIRDARSGQVGDQEQEFQSFAITSSERFRLPPGLSRLRCAKGFHGISGGGTARHLAMRLFYQNGNRETATIHDLGLDDEILKALEYMRYRDAGALIIGGSTGQGKNTTLVRALEKLHQERMGNLSIVSVESPIEIGIDLPGVIQIPVPSVKEGEARNEAYVSALRHFKRIHPDVGLVSEITDKEGAEQTVEFVSSGHVCYTTVHANSCIEVPYELIAKGISPSSIARPNFLAVAMAQILIKTLCDHCALPAMQAELTAYLRDAQNIQFSGVRLRNKDGCAQCHSKTANGQGIWNGYSRVIAVAEVVIPDDKMRAAFAANDPTGAYEHWRRKKGEGGLGGRRIADKLVDLVCAGRIDPGDAMNRGMIVALEAYS